VRGKRLALTFVLAAAATFCATDAARGALSCTISAVGVSFGTYNVFGASPLDSTGSVTYTCTGIVGASRINITLSRGSAPTFNPRRMLKSGEILNYNLYLDAARTTIWGDATSGTSRYGPIKPISTDTITIYGRIPAGQDASAGSYTDTVIATINF
jgi:spore coat protein U-like protein